MASGPALAAAARSASPQGVSSALTRTTSSQPPKPPAVTAAMAAVTAGGFGGCELVVRVNALETPWGDADLAAAASAGPDAILAPKVRGPDDVLAYDRAIAGAPAHTRLWVMIETVQSIFALDAIAGAAPKHGASRLAGLVM